MTTDDALFRFRLRVFALAEEVGVRPACRTFGIHPSTYYRWRRLVLRHGLEMLRPRERRPPRMPNATAPFVEQRVVAFALGQPGFGPARIAAELARPKWGGIRLSPNGVWRVLRRHGLSTRAKRLALVAGYAAPPEPERPEPAAERHLDVSRPGELVQLDCFCIGRLSGTRGTVWQYTAIDVGSAYVWAELHVTPRNPSARWTSQLARRVAAELAARGWQLEAVMTDIQTRCISLRSLAEAAARPRIEEVGTRPPSLSLRPERRDDSLPVDHEVGGITAGGCAPSWEPGDRAPYVPGSLLANVRCDLPPFGSERQVKEGGAVEGGGMELRLGIDIACRAAHQASLADERGQLLWTGRRFHTRAEELERLWELVAAQEPDQVLVIMEPTRNAWVPLAAWFRRRGARVVLVPPEQSADLRAYYSKHAKTDRLDSRLLAQLPLLHPEGLHDEQGLGPGHPMRRATRLRQTLVKRRTTSLARLDALLELLGPAWLAAFSADLANKTPLRFLAAGYACPDTVRRLGKARLARFLHRHSRGAWGADRAERLLAAADETLALWRDELDYAQLAEDIALEARVALFLTDEVAALDERIALQFAEADPAGILTSTPGVGPITGAQILSRLGDPNRFRSLAGVRSFSGLVPSLSASGFSGRHGPPTRAGDAALREALFIAADHARRIDPTLAERYHRLMVNAGKHHNSALCHIATTLLTRIVACWRRQERYVIRDGDGRAISVEEGRRIVSECYSVPPELRRARRVGDQERRLRRTGWRSQESLSAPTPSPSSREPTAAASA